MKKKLTIYDIADEMGLSWSTVGTILNGSWQKRRISETTANAVMDFAKKHGYTANLTASGLRRSRSGLVGLILPMLDNRFFSSLESSFESATREIGLYPVAVSTQRDAEREQATVRALLSINVDALVIAGATNPDRISDLCRKAGVRHVNVDLPGTKASSVISDNMGGAVCLSNAILEEVNRTREGLGKAKFCFIGGVVSDHNTRERIEGFNVALQSAGIPESSALIRPTGYGASEAEAELRSFHTEFGRLPNGLFVNSTIAFEGVVRFLRTLPLAEVKTSVIGCFDWDPYIELLHYPVFMVRQDVDSLIRETYRVLGPLTHPRAQLKGEIVTIRVPTQFVDYRN